MENFEKFRIKGDLIDSIPNEKLIIEYPSGVWVNLGNKLTPNQVKDEPKYSFNGQQADKLYTLIFVDPDAKSVFLHGLINNIQGSDFSKGDVAAEYVGSGPPKGTGKHRYVFLVYEQPDAKRIEVETKVDNKSLAGRLAFDLKKYVNEHGFGTPVAGNFYRAEYDNYTDILMARFKSQLETINNQAMQAARGTQY